MAPAAHPGSTAGAPVAAGGLKSVGADELDGWHAIS
jgi:hypothetical protein